jgi:predicted transcriptional regulator
MIETGGFPLPISVELSPEQEAALLESAKRLKVGPEALAGAAIRDFLAQQDTDFQAAADRVLRKNKELYRRLA